MATQLSDLRSQLLSEIKIDPNNRINSVALLNRNINRSIRKIQQDANYSLPQNVEIATITTVSGTQESTLPSNFIRVASPQAVKIGGSTPLYPVDYVALTGVTDPATDSGRPIRYYVRKDDARWAIGFSPVPDSGFTVTVPYYKKLTEPTGDTDESPLDDMYDEAIVQYAAFLTMRRIKGYEDMATAFLVYYREAVDDVTVNTQTADQYSSRVGMQRRGRGAYYNPRG